MRVVIIQVDSSFNIAVEDIACLCANIGSILLQSYLIREILRSDFNISKVKDTSFTISGVNIEVGDAQYI